MLFLSTSKPRRELLERLKGNLEEVQGSEYVSVKREDLEQLMEVEKYLFSDNDLLMDDCKQTEAILYMFLLKHQGKIEELKRFMDTQTIVEDMDTLKDLEEYAEHYAKEGFK